MAKSQFSQAHMDSPAKKQDAPASRTLPPDLVSDLELSETGMLARDLFNRVAVPPDPKSCDTRAQSPMLGELAPTCSLDVADIYKKTEPSVFKILNRKFEAIGSGAYVCDGDTCAVVTNNHVGRLGPSDATYFLQSKDQIFLGKAAPVHSAGDDLFLIEPIFPDPQSVSLKPVKIGEAPAKSDSVLSVCYPSAKLAIPVVTAGKVLDTNGQVHVNDGMPGLSPPSIITDQSIYGGCSGGPDFNKSGEYIGVTRANGAEGAVVVKAEHVRELLQRYKQSNK
jgi:S1-C subfamily serine protease